MNEIRQSLGEIPIVEDELRKAAGDEQVGQFNNTFTSSIVLVPTPQCLVHSDRPNISHSL